MQGAENIKKRLEKVIIRIRFSSVKWPVMPKRVVWGLGLLRSESSWPDDIGEGFEDRGQKGQICAYQSTEPRQTRGPIY